MQREKDREAERAELVHIVSCSHRKATLVITILKKYPSQFRMKVMISMSGASLKPGLGLPAAEGRGVDPCAAPLRGAAGPQRLHADARGLEAKIRPRG